MKRIISLLLVLVLCLGLFAGCGKEATTDEPAASVATEPKAPEVQEPAEESGLKADITYWSSYTETSNYGQVILAAADAFMKENPGVTIEIQQSDSSTGITDAIDGISDIGMASRALKDSELEQGVSSTTIAMDGIAVIVNNDNPLDNLTSEQVKNIFMGEVTVWSEVKG